MKEEVLLETQLQALSIKSPTETSPDIREKVPWFMNGALHRDLPASDVTDQEKKWYMNGKLRRNDGMLEIKCPVSSIGMRSGESFRKSYGGEGAVAYWAGDKHSLKIKVTSALKHGHAAKFRAKKAKKAKMNAAAKLRKANARKAKIGF
jgi:hypothetical protein